MNHTSRPRRSPEQWQQIINRQISSGMSQEAFCKSENLCSGTFSNWKRRLKKAPGDTADKDWVELPASLSPASEPPPWAMELELPGGVILRMRA